MKKNKKNYSAEQLNQIATGLTGYFGHLWDFIEASNSATRQIKKGKLRKRKRDWHTVKDFKLDDVTLLRRFNDPKRLVGVRFQTAHGKTNYLMLDIDITSQYHPDNDPNGLDPILTVLEDMGLPMCVYVRSSDSGGLHLFIALSRPMPVFDAACWLELAMLNAGLEVKAGQLELFPNTKQFTKDGQWSLYNAHNLPMQPQSGSYLMDDELNITSDNILDFLHQMDFAAEHKNIVTDEMMLEAKIAREALTKQRLLSGGFSSQLSSQKVRDWKEDLEYYLLTGWTGRGETNDLLIKFGCYSRVFLGLEDEAHYQYILETAQSAEGYAEHCGHKHEIEKRCQEIAKLTQKYYWQLGTKATRSIIYTTMQGQKVIANGNEAKTLNTSERLEAVIAYIQESYTSFKGNITDFANLIIETSKEKFKVGFSTKTLFNVDKYLPLWKPLFTSLVITATPIEADSMPKWCPKPNPNPWQLSPPLKLSLESQKNPPRTILPKRRKKPPKRQKTVTFHLLKKVQMESG